jgi:hypothetical protein
VPSVIRSSKELRQYAFTAVSQPIAQKDFRDRLSGLLAHAAEGTIREYKFLTVSGDLQSWLETGIECNAGEEVTILSAVRVESLSESLSESLFETGAEMDANAALWRQVSLRGEAQRGVWYRIGSDQVPSRGARSSYTFTAQHTGSLFLAPTPIGSQRSASGSEPEGEQTSSRPHVDRCVLVVRWARSALHGLTALRAGGDVGGIVDSALDSQRTSIEVPSGWSYPSRGEADNFAAARNASDDKTIACITQANAALLLKDARLPLGPDTKLCWSWKMEQLPSKVREDALSTHDYLSIGVEFDNGRDLTYYWSAELPGETGFPCPIPGWEDRETHVVIRTGREGLGEWIEEERHVYSDYLRHVGQPPPNIVRVWLLAVAHFQGGEGQCEYGRIDITSGGKTLKLN